MVNFDIASLNQFEPAKVSCLKCKALFKSGFHGFGLSFNEDFNVALKNFSFVLTEEGFKCPICNVLYVSDSPETASELGVYLQEKGHLYMPDDLFEHSRRLARITSNSHSSLFSKLFDVLAEAKSFVHYITYGIAHQFIGALKLTSRKIPVRGLISGVDEQMIREVKEDWKESGFNWETVTFDSEADYRNFPHQKLIVIDGLVAFKGSANLTLNGWRKASEGKEIIEVITDLEQVIQLNNSYFSPLWAEHNSRYREIKTFDFERDSY